MTFFRVDASIRQEGSVTRELADAVQRSWTEHHPDDDVVRRDLAVSPLPADLWQHAATAGFVPEEERTPEQRSAVAVAAQLADELLAADAIVVASPLYNYGISQHLKTWLDVVIADPRFAGTAPLTAKPVTVVVARGGGYAPGTPREGWDHASPYIKRILGDYLGGDVTVVTAELTLADVNPAMAELRDQAAVSRAEANELAVHTGRAHAELVAVARRKDADLSGVA